MPKIVLASTSPWRKALLDTLGITFEQVDPALVEDELASESPTERAIRLAGAKANAVRQKLADDEVLIIASDQVAHRDDRIFHKPGTFDAAVAQLKASSGQWVTFTTAVCLAGARSGLDTRCEHFAVRFRSLTGAEIRAYLERDRPFDAAGSIKAESLGIVLLEDTHGRDVNTLYGLPLMLLTEMLADAGINVLIDFK